MISYVTGNLLDSEAQALVNTVNTVGVMGKGLALQFKERYPLNYRLYKDACKKGIVVIGKMFITRENTLQGEKIIINFPTKTTWRKPSSYPYIESGLASLREDIIKLGIKTIAIPPLGSRNGGLDWNQVKPMIVSALSDLACEVFVYEPNEVILEKMRSERVKLTPARAMMLDVIYDMVNQGDFASEFAAEKIVYFLQRFGAKDTFKLEFKHAFYGPYSGKVRYVLRYLNGSYLMGLTEMNQKPFDPIWIIPEGKQVVSDYLAKQENRLYGEISAVTKLFLDGFYSNYSLELLSTTDFILQNDNRLQKWGEMNRDDVVSVILEDISSWSNRKRELFGHREYINIMFEHLREWQGRIYMALNSQLITLNS